MIILKIWLIGILLTSCATLILFDWGFKDLIKEKSLKNWWNYRGYGKFPRSTDIYAGLIIIIGWPIILILLGIVQLLKIRRKIINKKKQKSDEKFYSN